MCTKYPSTAGIDVNAYSVSPNEWECMKAYYFALSVKCTSLNQAVKESLNLYQE